MNNQRFTQQQHHQNQHNGHRSQFQSNRAQFSQKDQLERDLRYLEREMITLDVQIDALREKGMRLEAAKNAHQAAIPAAIAQVVLSNLGVHFLPPVARTWYYKHQQYQRAEEQLKQYALTLATKRNALTAQIEYIEIQIEMLQYQP